MVAIEVMRRGLFLLSTALGEPGKGGGVVEPNRKRKKQPVATRQMLVVAGPKSHSTPGTAENHREFFPLCFVPASFLPFVASHD